MSIEYTYTITSVNQEENSMVVDYVADGYSPQTATVRLPTMNVETLEDVISLHAPFHIWSQERITSYAPEVGTSGTLQVFIEPSVDTATLRFNAYVSEADPLFFKMQRGEATQQEWLDKIAAIKAQFPKDDGSAQSE